MTEKDWILIAGIVLFAWWRGSSAKAATVGSSVSTSGGVGYSSGGSAPVSVASIPQSAGNSNTPNSTASVVAGTTLMRSTAAGVTAGESWHNNIAWTEPVILTSGL